MASEAQVPPAEALYEPFRRSDLRQAFLDAAVVMVKDRGEERFSLNELARKLGVSPGAAYRHFANKESLLAAVCGYGYRQLADTLAGPFAPGLPAGERVLELASRYIHFAENNSDLFAMMFGTRTLDIDEVGERTFLPLVTAVAQAQREGNLPSGDVRVLSGALWTSLHGTTTLHLNGRLATMGLDDTPGTLVRRYLTLQFPALLHTRGQGWPS